MFSTAESEHRFPQSFIKHPYYMHSFAMDVPPWTRHSGMSGRAEGKTDVSHHLEQWPPRDVCSCCGGSAGANWHPAKSSGSESIWCKMSCCRLDSHAYMQTHLVLGVCANTPVLQYNTHIWRRTNKSMAQNGCNLATGEPAHCLWPLLSLPSGSSGASC